MWHISILIEGLAIKGYCASFIDISQLVYMIEKVWLSNSIELIYLVDDTAVMQKVLDILGFPLLRKQIKYQVVPRLHDG